MQLRRFFAIAGGVSVAAFGAAAPAFEVDEQRAGYRFEFFSDSDDVHVYSNLGEYEISLSGESRLFLGWNHETVVVPAITAAPGSEEAVDAISGASRPIAASENAFSDFTKTRNQLDVQVAHRGYAAGYYLSREIDYVAQRVSGTVQRRLRSDHLTLSAGGSYGWDDIEPLADEDTAAEPDRRTTVHANLVVTQVLGPTTLAQAGVEWNEVRGLQHNPYRTVYVAGTNVPEAHPEARTRRDAFFKISQWLSNRSSVKLGYKFYQDDWGVDSHTVNLKLNQYVGDAVVVRYRYRWYSQSAADFWRDEYSEPGGVNGYRTGDYRLGDFDAHLFGTKLSWDLGQGPFSGRGLEGLRWNVEYERYFNANNFSANIFESGLALSF